MQADPRADNLRLATMEDPVCGLHRIAMLEIAGALRHLAEPGPNRAASVHECRKAIKRLRALACLARHRDPAGAGRIDRILRRAGRSLSGQRDADVVVATARAVKPSHVTAAVAAALRSITANAVAGDAADAATALGRARRRFEELFDLAGTWRADELMDAVVGEFELLQRRGSRYLATLAEVDAHELRKSVQRCLAQLRVLCSVTQADVEGRIELLNDLAQKLGKHHDLTVLRATLKAVPESTLSKADRRQLRRTARAKQRSIDAELNAVLQGLAAASAATLRFELIGDLATDHATSTAHRNDPLTGQPGSGGAHGGD